MNSKSLNRSEFFVQFSAQCIHILRIFSFPFFLPASEKPRKLTLPKNKKPALIEVYLACTAENFIAILYNV